MDQATRNRVIRTAIQAAIPAALAAVASLTTSLKDVTDWWAPLVLAGLTVITSLGHQYLRPAAPAAPADPE